MHKKNLKSQILGLEEKHLDFDSLEAPLHCDVIKPVKALKVAAARAGFDLRLASGFRSFSRQLAIWNGKAEGKRDVLDDCGEKIDINPLTESELVLAIARWSAIPGASRHHWGTDFDVYPYDRSNPSYQLQLTVEESEGQGLFREFYQWLDQFLIEAGSDFFRPYARDLGGVMREPWHLSFRPLSEVFENAQSLQDLTCQLNGSEVALKETILGDLPSLYSRFVTRICKD